MAARVTVASARSLARTGPAGQIGTARPGVPARGPGEDGGPLVNGADTVGEDGEMDIDGAAVAAYRASMDSGKPLSERKLAAMFGKTSRRWARNRIAEAAESVAPATATQ